MDRLEAPTGERLLARFGISPEAETVWHALLAEPSMAMDDLASQCRLPDKGLRVALEALLDSGFVRSQATPSGVAPIDPSLSIETQIVRAERELVQSHQELSELRARIPELATTYECGRATRGDHTSIELVVGIDEIRREIDLASERTNTELRSLLHFLPAEDVRRAREADLRVLARGVRQRAIVGVGDLTERALYDELALLHQEGEELRTLPTVPTRLLIFDSELAVLPVEATRSPRRAMFIRDRTLIVLLTYIFDHLWAEASHVFISVDETALPSNRNVRVLELLAVGAKDEAIARTLGVGVRTVRRHRVAEGSSRGFHAGGNRCGCR